MALRGRVDQSALQLRPRLPNGREMVDDLMVLEALQGELACRSG